MTTETHDDYTVAWICALPLEAAAACSMLDRTHSPLPIPSTDSNAYQLGELNGHYIVIASLPNGIYGKVSAATVVSRMRSTFPQLQYGLTVGIGGGVPGKSHNIRLGDVVVSKPGGKHSGVIQYDYGKAIQNSQFESIGTLNKPPLALLTHVSQLEAKHIREGRHDIPRIVRSVLEHNPSMKERFSPPDQHKDLLFQSAYHHVAGEDTCEKCDKEQLIKRYPRDPRIPHIHHGLVASGDQVMKDSETRDRLAQEHGILCFELEAAGVMDQLPTLAIRGICDYSDSHKQKQWQGYAALTAAAYAKLLLSMIPVTYQDQRLLRHHENYTERCVYLDSFADHPSEDKGHLKYHEKYMQRVLHEMELDADLMRTLIRNTQNANNDRSQNVVPKKPGASCNPRPASKQLHVVDYYRSSSECGSFCLCKCHAPKRLCLSLLDGGLGRIEILVSRSPSGRSMCTETTCVRRSVCVSRTMIQLPNFLFKKIIYLAIGVYPNCRLDMSLKVIRVVPDNAEIMQYAKKGRLDDVRSLINQHLASPTDVNDSWGVPVLNYAVQGLHIDLCKFLLDQGADPCVENRSNISALDRAWDFVLSRSTDDDTENKLRSVFSLWYDSVWFEDQQFSRLHKIVLGAVDRDLNAELELSTADINTKDAKGRTPIAWASARGDWSFVRTLLSFGADPNISCASGNDSLMRSVQSRSSECVRLLLAHGANIELDSTLGFTALHYAAYYQDDEAYLKPLLDFGAPIDQRDRYGWTSLSCTAEYDHSRSAQILISNGANIDIPDDIGWTAVVRAVSSNSHRVLKLLLNSGADVSTTSSRSESLLHVAAARGDLETMSILAASTLRCLNAHMKDSRGRTAAEIMNSRALPSSDLSVAFYRILHSMGESPRS